MQADWDKLKRFASYFEGGGATLAAARKRFSISRRTFFRWMRGLEARGYTFSTSGYDPTYYNLERKPRPEPQDGTIAPEEKAS